MILQGLPGVGPERARALLDGFGSIAAVMAADAERLAGVDGIGSRVSGDITKAIGTEPPPDPPGEVSDPELAERWQGTWGKNRSSRR